MVKYQGVCVRRICGRRQQAGERYLADFLVCNLPSFI